MKPLLLIILLVCFSCRSKHKVSERENERTKTEIKTDSGAVSTSNETLRESEMESEKSVKEIVSGNIKLVQADPSKEIIFIKGEDKVIIRGANAELSESTEKEETFRQKLRDIEFERDYYREEFLRQKISLETKNDKRSTETDIKGPSWTFPIILILTILGIVLYLGYRYVKWPML